MKKLKLDVSLLRVETFDSGDERIASGTVRGHGSYPYRTCYEGQCTSLATDYPNETCPGAIGKCFPDSIAC